MDLQKIKNLEEINNIIFSNTSLSNTKNNSKNNNIIFIYTPPKVGSTSLVSSLRISATYKFTIVHIHDEIMLSLLIGNKMNGITINDIILYNKSLGKNVFVIDIFRSPIERKISEYFEKIATYHFNNTEENVNNYNLNVITHRFNKIFPHLSKQEYFQEKYDISIPDKFDFENKYLLVESNGIKYIKLRLCDSSEWSVILTKLLETEIIMIHDYQTENKKIGELYKKFKDNYRIPKNLFELIQTSPLLEYYFSEKERNLYLKTWDSRITTEVIPYTDAEYILYTNLSIENQYLNEFQFDHYIDVGCICFPCSKKRSQIFERAKKGEKINEKIIHQQAVIQYKNKIIQTINKKIIKHQNMKKNKIKTQANKRINNYMANLINNK